MTKKTKINPRLEIRNKVRIYTGSFNKIRLKILYTIAMKKEEDLKIQKELAQALEMPISTLNYHITKLRQEGLINNFNELTSEGKRAIQYFNHWDKTCNKKLRAHKIQISIKILALPTNFFNIKHKILSPFTNQKYRGLKGELNGTKIIFYSSKKLILKIPDIYAQSNEEIIGTIEQCLDQIYQMIRLEFPGIKLGDYEICKFNSMHCAILNSLIAKSFLLKKGSCFQSENICIDGSHGVPELECENLKDVFDTMDILLNYEELAKKHAEMENLINMIKPINNINAKNILAKTEKDDSKMRSLQQRVTLPQGYGTYFM